MCWVKTLYCSKLELPKLCIEHNSVVTKALYVSLHYWQFKGYFLGLRDRCIGWTNKYSKKEHLEAEKENFNAKRQICFNHKLYSTSPMFLDNFGRNKINICNNYSKCVRINKNNALFCCIIYIFYTSKQGFLSNIKVYSSTCKNLQVNSFYFGLIHFFFTFSTDFHYCQIGTTTPEN